MIDGLKPYPKYKESRVPWLSEIPRHWGVDRLKLCAGLNERSLPETTPSNFRFGYIDIGSVATGRLVRQPEVIKFADAPSRARRIVRPGDTIISTVRTYLKAVYTIGSDADNLVVSTGFAVVTPKPHMNPGYLSYALRSETFVDSVVANSTGTAYPAIPETLLARLPLPYPPSPSEQAAIVRFLDHADRLIRQYIRAKKRLIALLNEQKRAIVHQAVTRGLDPGVKLRPSGVSWLGDVPAHWDLRRLKQTITPVEQGWSPQCDAQPADADEWGVLKVGCVNKEDFDYLQNKRLPKSLSPEPALEIQDGDILVSRANTRELLGLAALAEKPRPKLILCDKLFRFRVRQDILNPRFIVHLLRAKPSRAQIESSTNGASSSMQNIGQDVLRNLWIAFPPTIDEQKSICTLINDETSIINVTISRALKEIDLLNEYRTRLIADLVTGKLDVREAAARLPDEASREIDFFDVDEAAAEGADELDDPDLEGAALEAGA